jgi:hypothetical protein
MFGRSTLLRGLSLAASVALLLLVGAAGAADPKAEGKAPYEGKAAAPAPAFKPSGVKMDRAALTAFIDRKIDERLRLEKVAASPLADDAEFLRRVYLDLIGKIPTPEQAAAFLDSKDPAKRAKLIDELLASPEYGRRMADIWETLLLPRNSDNRGLDRQPMVKWLEESFNANKPWDKLVSEILTASGPQDKNAAVTYYLSNIGVDKMTGSVTRYFLGVQLQCAQCHNHPFTDWKQAEYWGFAAFFANVQATPVRLAAQQQQTPEVKEGGGFRGPRGPRPEGFRTLSPKFLAGAEPKIPGVERRPVLAAWVTSADNPYFAKAMVNRAWGQLFGRGFVNPVDDMHDGNTPSHPELLGELAYQFAAGGFDLKDLYRAVCNSQGYQRSSKPSGGNADAPPVLFARMAVKALTPEQLFDSLTTVLGAPRGGPGPGRGPMGGGGRFGPGNPRAAFVAFFGVEDGGDVLEYQAGIPQALRLMNSPQLNNTARLNEILRDAKDARAGVEKLFLAALSRRPTPQELDRYSAYVEKQKEARDGYADLLWALLNSSAFTLNH